MNKQNKWNRRLGAFSQGITNGEQFHNFMLFGANYPYLFIEHCWKDKGAIMTHLRSKFHGSKSFTDFWFMLDSSNRDILGDYISRWGMNDASFDDDYEASVKLAWNDVKEYIASSWQKEFYWNICVTEPCKTPLGKSLAKALGEI